LSTAGFLLMQLKKNNFAKDLNEIENKNVETKNKSNNK
jgi:hypothetical protein